IDQRDIVIGIVARLDPMKGYMVLSKAAKEILEKHKNTVFFSVGYGDENIKIECQKVLEYNNRFIWLGQQYDVERLYAGFDIVVSSSSSESFSNSIAEAMSSGCMVVVTDVGDSRRIVGDIGVVVEPNNVDALLCGIDRALQSNYKYIGRMCRDRILNNFSIKNMIESTQMEIIKCVE
ncbi:glycosyltransferase, partial [Campylobacter concisus]|uniref:glycosyltransferase n=1 Tax=Campylobacter concisus TaxID=199 RepID=UPI00165F438C